ncbi:MAG: alpha/beta hydrolase [Rhodospirillaceae bacterium]|jgi:acetyl esterase|nr:alpha/beta hydrolase [Rhodospirillaceae bacterium]
MTFDINACSIFLERDDEREEVKRRSLISFKSILDREDFSIQAMLYEPEDANDDILLYFHGGGWVTGSITSHDFLCRKITNAMKIRLVSVEYRLAPTYKFPFALNDALSSYCRLFDNEINFRNVILVGDSSGGNLCASLCIKLMEINFSRRPPSSQILFYPFLSNDFNSESFVKYGKEIELTKAMGEWFINQYTGKDIQDEESINNKLIYPILENDMSVFPKTTIVSAEKDILFDGNFLFAQKLRNAGIAVEHIIIENAKHGFMSYGTNCSKYGRIALEKLKGVQI